MSDRSSARTLPAGKRAGFATARVEASVSLLGKVIADRFEVRSVIAKGGFGVVLLGVDRWTDEYVAIKVLHRAPETDEARFWREVELMAKVEHPALVRLLSYGKVPPARPGDGALPYLVMEHVDGITLRRFAQTHGLMAPLDCLTMLRPIASALDTLHAHHIVHRDVKLDNIMIGRGGPLDVRLVDLGIAFALDDVGERLTGEHHMVGSPAYVAPEAARGVRPAPTMDSYSLAVCAYELLTGARPHRGTSELDVLQQKLVEPPEFLTHVSRHTFTVPFECAMRECLSSDPSDRPPTATGVLDRLAGALRR